MQFNFQTEEKDNSQVCLKITVDKEEVKKHYNELLLDAQKNITINGFRKGKVPFSILEMRFKEAILSETSNKLIDDSYKEVYEKLEKKPLNFATPKLENFKLAELDKDFDFELIYDVFPNFKMGEYKGLEIEKDEVSVTDKDVTAELEKMVKEFATIETKEGKIEDGDIVSVDYTVLENGNEVFKKDGEYIHIGKDYDFYKIGKDLIGAKKDDEKEFKKKYGKKEIESLADKTFNFKVKIKDVKREVLPVLTDELAKQIDESCNTVTELKDKLKKNLEDYSTNFVKQKGLGKILKELTATFEGYIPESMINQQLEAFYNELLQRFYNDEKRALAMLKKEGLTKETYLEKMKDQAVEEIKKGLILNEIVKKEEIKVSEDDIKTHIESFAKHYKMKVEDLFEYSKKSGSLKVFENEVESKKALDFLYDNAKVKKGKKLTFEEMTKVEENKEETENK
ncbi:MAG: trigger factor [Spirochaetes bacterium GWC1_27_15]|nr:MAG: trigger factor [Spirochaetes bacterium GWB1_27_13]OHD26253.1 MAG: trigger factor [Spirochaetes bacterium GWC1_27_15]